MTAHGWYWSCRSWNRRRRRQKKRRRKQGKNHCWVSWTELETGKIATKDPSSFLWLGFSRSCCVHTLSHWTRNINSFELQSPWRASADVLKQSRGLWIWG